MYHMMKRISVDGLSGRQFIWFGLKHIQAIRMDEGTFDAGALD